MAGARRSPAPGIDFRPRSSLLRRRLRHLVTTIRRPVQETGGQRPTARCALGRENVWSGPTSGHRGRTRQEGIFVFDSLSERLSGILDRLTRRGALTEADVDAALREVRRALIEADVALDVARAFVDKVRERAVGVAV